MAEPNCLGVAELNRYGVAEPNCLGVAELNRYGVAEPNCLGVAELNRYGVARGQLPGGPRALSNRAARLTVTAAQGSRLPSRRRTPIYGERLTAHPYRLPLPMALLSSADAIAALTAAGWTAYRSPARANGRCQTLCYVVGGQPVNLGRLRQLACEVLSPAAEPVATEPPAAAEPVVSAEPPARAQVEIDPYKQGRWQRTGIGPDPVAVAERRAARWAERNPEHSYRVVAVAPAAAEPVAPAAPEPVAPVPAHPWDPGTPAARERVALQGERVAILWPIAQAVRGAGLTLPGAWASDGPVMSGEWSEARAMAALWPEAIRAAAVALAALPPVTRAQVDALTLCRAALAWWPADV